MIDYRKIADAIEFYKARGYTYIETPWTVSENIDNITKPADRPHMQLKHNNKCLVASGEQSFLYLFAKDYLPKGKYQTVTPCFRYEPYDGLHSKCFMKNELIITDDVTEENLRKVINDAKEFFSKYINVKVECILDTYNKLSPMTYDIVTEDGEIELGSYGIRTCGFLKWIYGTGVAEPRLSKAIEYKQING